MWCVNYANDVPSATQEKKNEQRWQWSPCVAIEYWNIRAETDTVFRLCVLFASPSPLGFLRLLIIKSFAPRREDAKTTRLKLNAAALSPPQSQTAYLL